MKRKTKKKSAVKTTLTAAAALLAAGTTFGALFGEAPTIPQEETSIVSLERTAPESAEPLSDELTAELPEIEELSVPEEAPFDYTSVDVSVQSEKAMADDLKSLGLFRGVTETDYALDRAPTRTEAVVMLLRVLGKENDILSANYSHPFTDVPDWASPYIGYAYTTGLSQGISQTEFGSGNASAAMYLTLVLRSLGYSDTDGTDFTWDNPYTLAVELGILSERVDTTNFLRGDIVTISHAVLSAKFKNSEETLSDRLIAENIFSQTYFNDIYYSIEELYIPEPDFIETLTVPETPAEPEPVIETIPVIEPVVEIPAEPAVEPIPEPVIVPEPEPIAEPEPVPEPIPEPIVSEPVVETPPVQETPIYVEPEPAPKPTITIVHDDSSMTPELIAELENIAVFWAPTGEKYHIKHNCQSFKLGVAYAGTLAQAQQVRPKGWCGTCSKGQSDNTYTSNRNATAEVLAECYTYNDYCNYIPYHVFDR